MENLDIKALTDEELKEAKSWINDCQWLDIFDMDDINKLSIEEITKGIERHYDGGLIQFKRNCNHE